MSPPFGLRLPLDLADPTFCQRKFEVYAWLLEEQPRCEIRYSVLRAHMLSRYADCAQLLRDPRFLRAPSQVTGAWAALLPRSWRLSFDTIVNKDAEDHKRLRGFIHRAFTPGAVRRLEPQTQAIAGALMDGMEAKARAGASVDLITDFAAPLPAQVTGALLGVDPAETQTFAALVADLVEATRGWGVVRGLAWDLPQILRFIERLIARKREAPADDLLSELVHLEEAGDRLSHDELAALTLALILGGYETTAHLISSGMTLLFQHPEALAALRADPQGLPAAIEELLRLVSPAQITERGYPVEDVELGGLLLPKGQPVVACVGAANRDPRVFERPDVFDPHRSPNRHLVFGQGAHYCVGAALARMEGRLAFEGLFERFPDLQLAAPPDSLVVRAVPGMHTLESVPVRWGASV